MLSDVSEETDNVLVDERVVSSPVYFKRLSEFLCGVRYAEGMGCGRRWDKWVFLKTRTVSLRPEVS